MDDDVDELDDEATWFTTRSFPVVPTHAPVASQPVSSPAISISTPIRRQVRFNDNNDIFLIDTVEEDITDLPIEEEIVFERDDVLASSALVVHVDKKRAFDESNEQSIEQSIGQNALVPFLTTTNNTLALFTTDNENDDGIQEVLVQVSKRSRK